MGIRDYLAVLQRRWLWVVTGVLLGVVVATSVVVLSPREYTSSTQLFFSTTSGQTAADINQGSTFTQQQMKSYAQVATSPSVLQPVIDKYALGITPDEFAKQITATVATSTVVLELGVTDKSPQRAQQLASAVADEVVTVVGGLAPARADGTKAVQVTVIAPALVPDTPSSPKKTQDLALGLLAGLVLGVALAMVVENVDTKVRSRHELSDTGIPVIGDLPKTTGDARGILVLDGEVSTPWSEAVRRLRTNLQFVSAATEGSVFAVTSSVPNEGKTTVALALASALAGTGRRVLLVDADLRRPRIATVLGIESHVGLTTVLIGRARLQDVVQPWHDSTLDILPSGRHAPNPSELLGSARMGDLVAEMAGAYDVVIVDAPPVLPVADAITLAHWAAGMLVVVRAGVAKRPEVAATLDSLQRVDARVMGLVVNCLEGRHSGYGYGYGYSYAGDPSEDVPPARPPHPDHHDPEPARAASTTMGIPIVVDPARAKDTAYGRGGV